MRCTGVFVQRDFLGAAECARLRDELRETASDAGRVVERGRSALDEDTRSVRRLRPPPEATALVRDRLLALRPALARFHGTALSGCEPPQFLRYREGDFYRPHRDSLPDPDVPRRIRERRVSAVLFLTGEQEEPGPDAHRGGWLTLFGVIDDPERRDWGFPVLARAGSLVTFRSEVLHEVAPVTAGERLTAVTWLR